MVGPISSSPACCNVTLITVLSTACGGIGLVYRLSDGRRVEQTKERVCGPGAATVYSLEACELHLSWLLHCVLVPPGPGPGNTHNWKLDSYVDWLCERNQALVSWGWFRVWQEGENRECPVNECVYSQWLASDFNVHLGKLEHLAVSPWNASVQLYHTFFGRWRRNFDTCFPLLAKSALLTAIQTWSGDDIKLGLRSHLKWISLKLASQIN